MEIRIQCFMHSEPRAGGGEGKTDKNGQKEGEREGEGKKVSLGVNTYSNL